MPADVFQDFDIIYLVKDVKPYWDKYLRFSKTYFDTAYVHMWTAAFEMLFLFGDVARDVAKRLGFVYDEVEEQGIENYMKQVKILM